MNVDTVFFHAKSGRAGPVSAADLLSLHIAARLLADVLQVPVSIFVDQSPQGLVSLTVAQNPIPAIEGTKR
jgi:hypothetical protein